MIHFTYNEMRDLLIREALRRCLRDGYVEKKKLVGRANALTGSKCLTINRYAAYEAMEALTSGVFDDHGDFVMADDYRSVSLKREA